MPAVPPKKRFGQNFLHDVSYRQRILAALAARPGDEILEIGPGQGALTRGLLQSGAHIYAIEIDRDLVERLRADPELAGLDLRQGDVLNLDLATLAEGRPLRIIGNLPYNISTPLLFHLLAQRGRVRDMLFMLQEEVVERIVAGPGHEAYGRLSVMAQLYCTADLLLRVPAGAFWPVPKVQSAVVRLIPRPQPAVTLSCLPVFEDLVRRAFGQRRKMLRRSLQPAQAAALAAAGIDGERRPETLGLAEWVRLAELLGGAGLERSAGVSDPSP